MLVAAAAFVIIFGLVALCGGFATSYMRTRENKRLRAMFKTADAASSEPQIRWLRPAPTESKLGQAMHSLGLGARMNLVLMHSGLNWGATKWLGFSLASLAVGLFLGSLTPPNPVKTWIVAAAGLVAACIPTMIVLRARRKRLDQFTEQFPEALDFLARSLRAGHAFSIGLEMLVADSPEPLAGVFRTVLNELHLGAPQEEAFAKFIMLVPLVDVRFFTAAVMLQQETGGNLSEILSKLSSIIRDRFRLRGQVKAVSAHGRITALVLLLMPIVVAVMMYISSPAYLNVLFVNPIGHWLLAGSVIGQAVGYFVIKKIVNIKV
jgi:tight adherence protein B